MLSFLICMLSMCQGFLVSPSRPTIVVSSFTSSSRHQRSQQQQIKMSLDESAIGKLEEIRAKYDRLEAVVSDEAEKEREQQADVAEKYATYREIKSMMTKLRSMWRTEASERRRSKQLKSFTGLFEGKLELEELLKEKLGLPFQKDIKKSAAYENVLRMEAEVPPCSIYVFVFSFFSF